MPIYEYRCANCQAQFEKLHKTTDEALRDCPYCQAAQLQQLISTTSFQLKGSGWYVTDFKKVAPTAEPKAAETVSSVAGGNEQKPTEQKTVSQATDTQKAVDASSKQ